MLDEYDVIIFSDVEAKNFQLAPSFFDRTKFGTKVLTFPDRIRLTIDALHPGKGIMFIGGWLSFTGEMGKGGWNRTRPKEMLPVSPILGYNKTLPRKGCKSLLTVEQTGDPLVAVGTFKRGRALAHMSDPAPHWGCNFAFWKQYADFWLRCLEYVL